MAFWSVTHHQSILAHGRADAEFFQPAFLNAEAMLTRTRTNVIARHFHISDGNHMEVSRHFTEEDHSVPYYRGQDLNGFFLDNANPVRIPKQIYDRVSMHRSHFAPADVLICIVGASTGTISVVTSNTIPCTGSCKIGIVRRQVNGLVDPYVLAAFLLGGYGQYQIERHSRGTAQGGLILKDIFKLLVPLLPEAEQELIRSWLDGAISQNAQALSLYREAEELLAAELGLSKLPAETKVGYTTRASDLASSRRADAEFYSPAAREIVKRISALQHTTISESFNIEGGFPWNSNRFLPDNSGEPVVRIRNIKPSHIVPGELSSIEPAYAKSIGVPKAHKGDVVVGMDGIKYFYASLLAGECFVNQRVCHLSLRDSATISAEYAVFIINSLVGQAQLMRDMTVATTVGHITNRNVARLLVPTISSSLHDQVTGLVRNSIDSTEESKRLLKRAVSRVDQLIEEAALR